MNGVHDMGGMQGFGPVVVEENEPPFHEPWEGRVLAMVRAMLFTRAWNLDMFRYAQERQPGRVYLSVSYYHRWFLATAQNAIEEGLIGADELQAGHRLRDGPSVERVLTMKDADLGKIRPPFGRPAPHEASFKAGDKVRTKNINPIGHTRLPRYAREKEGVIEAIRGCHVYPDAAAAKLGPDPQWLYTVVFTARELWGDEADPTLTVSIEAFEPYLELI